MKLKLKDEYKEKSINVSISGKGGYKSYNTQTLKETQYQILFDNGHQHLFEVIEEDMPLYEIDEEDKGLIDYTSYKKKAVTAKKNNNYDNL